jgi:hypothetical protein
MQLAQLALLLSIFAPASCAQTEPQPPFWDVVLVGPFSNLARKYLWQSLFTLHAETRGALRVHAAAREANTTDTASRVAAVLSSNVTCGPSAARRCAALLASFSALVAPASTGGGAGLEALGRALTASAAAPGWRGRVIYCAVASELVPPLLARLGAWVDLAAPGSAVVLEKPVGSSRAGAAAILAALAPPLLSAEGLLLVDHYLPKAGVQLAARARAALARGSPAWRAALAQPPAATEAWALEAEDCEGRAGYYNTAGALRDMLLTHLTLAAAAALQPADAPPLGRAARAGVLAALRAPPLPPGGGGGGGGGGALALGRYAGAAGAHGLAGPGLVTAAGAALGWRGGRVALWAAKAAGARSAGVRQVLALGAGWLPGATGAAVAAAAARCGPLTLTFHVQGAVAAPSPALAARVAALGLGRGGRAPAVLLSGLCGAVGGALGDPAPLLAGALPPGAGARWEVRADAEAGLWGATLDAPPLSAEAALARAAGEERAAERGLPGAAGGGGGERGAEAALADAAGRLARDGGEAYTVALAGALAGRGAEGGAFITAEEVDRLWELWGAAAAEADAAAAAGGVEEYAVGRPPHWARTGEAGATLGGGGGGGAGARAAPARGSGGEL